MTVADLKTLVARLATGPVPTQEKKLFAVLGTIEELRQIVRGSLLIEKSLLDAFTGVETPESDEKLRELIPERLSEWLSDLQEERQGGVIVLRDAAILYRYQVPLTFLYDLTGDAHAIILHYARSGIARAATFPPHIRFDISEVTRFFENSLGYNCLTL
ncbi:MAG: hypothetical protein ACREA2_08340 [Blastocatellia bacterium]